MKVAFDHQIFAGQRFGGISRYFQRLAAGLGGLGAEPRVIAPFHRNAYLAKLPPAQRGGFDVDALPAFVANRLLALNPPLEAMTLRAWSPAVVHETYYAHAPRLPAGCARVVTVHDMIHELFPDEFRDGGQLARAKRAAVERADHVICVSAHTRRDLIALLGTPADKISVIHHGFDAFDDAAKQDLTPAPGQRPYLLYVGHRGGYKNFRALLQALAGSARLRRELDIVAFGGGAFSAEERAAIAALDFAEGAVRQIGGADEALAALYRHAAAFVYPSLYEGFGLPPLEAMARRCPVISSDASCMPEVIGDAALFFDPRRPEELAARIDTVLDDAVQRQALVERGLQRLQHYSWQRCARETHAVYLAAAAGTKPEQENTKKNAR